MHASLDLRHPQPNKLKTNFNLQSASLLIATFTILIELIAIKAVRFSGAILR
jgi:hypothetical protein